MVSIITSFLHLNKSFLVIRDKGEFQSDFCENLTEFWQISLKIWVNLTDFSPQVMACMEKLIGAWITWNNYKEQIWTNYKWI